MPANGRWDLIRRLQVKVGEQGGPKGVFWLHPILDISRGLNNLRW